MKYSWTFTTILAAGLIFTGCKDDDDPIQAVENVVNENSQLVQMRETWEAPCAPATVLRGVSQKTRFKFETSDFTETRYIYSDAACTKQIAQVRMSGRFDIEEIEGTHDVTDLDLTYEEVGVTLNDPSAVRIFSAVNFCGETVWAPGEERIISGAGGRNCFIAKVPTTVYGRIDVDDSADRMYLSPSFAADADHRADVDRTRIFAEVP